ncbi:hypothetical protein X997_4692 [Burkholderia pseudomallei A79C]|nr:hypothetical protein X997_4692 [Burkholderia pseudomallei A79C]
MIDLRDEIDECLLGSLSTVREVCEGAREILLNRISRLLCILRLRIIGLNRKLELLGLAFLLKLKLLIAQFLLLNLGERLLRIKSMLNCLNGDFGPLRFELTLELKQLRLRHASLLDFFLRHQHRALLRLSKPNVGALRGEIFKAFRLC